MEPWEQERLNRIEAKMDEGFVRIERTLGVLAINVAENMVTRSEFSAAKRFALTTGVGLLAIIVPIALAVW